MKNLLKRLLSQFGYSLHRELPGFRIHKEELNSYSKYYIKSENGLGYYETPIGNYFLPYDITTDMIANEMKLGKYFDEPIINIAKRYIRPNSSVLDIGSNFGQMSVLFSKLVGPNGRVYAFDADNYVFDILKQNISANNSANVSCIFGAVYDEIGKVLFFPKQDLKNNELGTYGSYGIEPNATKGREVKSLTVDSLAIIDPVSFIKVDIQGSDLAALRGAKTTILRNKMPIIFEFEQDLAGQFGTSFQDYVDFVDEIGYFFEEVVLNNNYLVLPKNKGLFV